MGTGGIQVISNRDSLGGVLLGWHHDASTLPGAPMSPCPLSPYPDALMRLRP
jgi:hypothetical protein